MASTQSQRILYLATPLGEDVLLLNSFAGNEAMSRLFSFHLAMVSETQTVKPADIVGKSVSWKVQLKDGEPRYFNGIVSRFGAGGLSPRMRTYRAEVVPWLWFLTRTANCRIFQKKSVPDIVKAIFGDLGFSDFKLELKNTYARRDYCVQYRETSFNFVSRLLEEEGIFYFFRHEEDKHTLVLADQKSSYQDLADKNIDVDSWDHQFEFRAGKWARTDYNFETPSTSLLTSENTIIKDVPDAKNYEMFDYPGDYQVKGDGTALTKLRMEEEEVPYEVGSGNSACYALTPGAKFTLQHDAESETDKGYVATSVQHSAADADFATGEGQAVYHNTFHCIPDKVVFRPGRLTPKPVIPGAQTAVVVGPAGEEIYTDKYGRVKVQFFWDRVGKKDENSSCWIRVSENWAGKNWGVVCNPRIGQEVVVEFLEGDPDRPLITGRVYNAEQMPPYDLPANQTQSGIKTRSSMKGTTENFNEIRFEDKKGKEHIAIHAERNLNISVEVNENVTVGNNRSDTVGTNPNGDPSQNGTVTETFFGDTKTAITKGNLGLDVQTGAMTVHVKSGVEETFDDTQATTVKNEIMIESTDADVYVKAKTQITLECGSSSITLTSDGTIEIKGSTIKISGSTSVGVDGGKIDSVADGNHTIKGAMVMVN